MEETIITPESATGKKVIGRPFAKGNPGKQKGTKYRLTQTVRDTVLTVFNGLQSHPRANLRAFAIKYPKDFYAIAAKLIPTEIKAQVEITKVTEIKLIRADGNRITGNTADENGDKNN